MLNKAPKLKSKIRAKAGGHVKLRPTSEAMVGGIFSNLELLTLLFIKNLAEEARTKAFEEKSATIRVHHLNAVSKKVLKKARG